MQYLEAKQNKQYININLMADELQRAYPDYERRKKSAFRALVKRAYNIILKSYSIVPAASSSDEDISDESPDDENDAVSTVLLHTA